MLAQLLAHHGAISPRGLVIAFICLVEFVAWCALAMAVVKSALSDAVYRRRRDFIKAGVALCALAIISLSLPADAGADSRESVVAADTR